MVESNSMRFHTPSAFKTESSPAELTFHNLVPDSGNDPLAYRLSSDCSTSELIGNIFGAASWDRTTFRGSSIPCYDHIS